jgi:hypothetical protein
MREGRVTRRAAAVEEAPAEAVQQEKEVRPAEAGEEKLSAGSAEPAATVARVGFAPIVRVDAVTREAAGSPSPHGRGPRDLAGRGPGGEVQSTTTNPTQSGRRCRAFSCACLPGYSGSPFPTREGGRGEVKHQIAGPAG